MPLKTSQQYLDSLHDDRTVYYRGERVIDVTTHPVISKAAKHACVDYEMAEDPETRGLAVVEGDELNGDQPYSRYFKIPRSRRNMALIYFVIIAVPPESAIGVRVILFFCLNSFTAFVAPS